MNVNNVIPYGALVHEVANAGGVEAYRTAQQQLINNVKRNSFNEGVEAERNRLLPWLIVSGVTAVGLGVKQLAPVVKKKFDSYRENREKLRKEAITAEKILVDNDEITQTGIQEMSGLSTKISYLKDVLSILKGIEIKLYPASQIREYGVATCRTPKKGYEENEPYIGIYNGNTNDFYKIALEIDPSGASCIMELIGTKIEVTKENTEILYIYIIA